MSSNAAARQLQHFDHTFKGEIHTISGSVLASVFGECSFSNRPVQITCTGSNIDLSEDQGLRAKQSCKIPYNQVIIFSFPDNRI